MENSKIKTDKSFFKGIFEVLGSVFGIEGKQEKSQRQMEEELERELEEIKREEEKIGATKRINRLGDSLQNHKENPEKLKIPKRVPKVKSTNINKEYVRNDEEREI